MLPFRDAILVSRPLVEVNGPKRLVAIEHSDTNSGLLNCETNTLMEVLQGQMLTRLLGLLQCLQMRFGK